jgi:hypothetical protein
VWGERAGDNDATNHLHLSKQRTPSPSPCKQTQLPPNANKTRIKTRIFPGAPKYGRLKLNSLYFEIGEVSFMKEAIASRVMAEQRLMAPRVEHVEAALNGQYQGLYTIVEDVGDEMVEVRAFLGKGLEGAGGRGVGERVACLD